MRTRPYGGPPLRNQATVPDRPTRTRSQTVAVCFYICAGLILIILLFYWSGGSCRLLLNN